MRDRARNVRAYLVPNSPTRSSTPRHRRSERDVRVFTKSIMAVGPPTGAQLRPSNSQGIHCSNIPAPRYRAVQEVQTSPPSDLAWCQSNRRRCEMAKPALALRAPSNVGGLTTNWSLSPAVTDFTSDKATVIFPWPSDVVFAVAMTTHFTSRRLEEPSAQAIGRPLHQQFEMAA